MVVVAEISMFRQKMALLVQEIEGEVLEGVHTEHVAEMLLSPVVALWVVIIIELKVQHTPVRLSGPAKAIFDIVGEVPGCNV